VDANQAGYAHGQPAEFAELAPDIIIAKKGEPPIRSRPVLARVDRRFLRSEVSV